MADNNTSVHEMDSIRIQKDIDLLWPVKTGDEYISFEGRDIKLFLTDPKGNKVEMSFDIVDGYNIHTVYYGKDHKYCGTHDLTLWENYGNLCLKDNVNEELCYSGLSTKPLEYTEYTHIDRNNVMWRSGNIGTDGSITTYANQITSFIVLPRKGCSLQCVGDSTYNIGIRQYDKDFNWLNNASVAKGQMSH